MIRLNLLDPESPAGKVAAKRLRQREVGRRFYHKHRERLRQKQRDNQAYNTRYAFLWSLKNEYGITKEQYDSFVLAQCGRCAVCSREGYNLHIDHDHIAGHVRGLLCGPCNQALGLVKDSPVVLRSLASYLESTSL